jgi:hypothetical protein
LDNTGYVVAGYALTAAALGGYLISLLSRARRARARAEALAKRSR